MPYRRHYGKDERTVNAVHVRIQRGHESGPPPPLKNHKNIGFLCNTGPDPLKNHKGTKPAFNVVPASARHRNAISMAFRWWADGGPFIAVFGYSIPPSTKKKKNQTKQSKKKKRYQIWTPSDKTFWIRAWLWNSMMKMA